MENISKEPNTGCWLWLGALMRDGYGELKIGGRGGKMVLAHRFVYEMFKGAIPEGMHLDHVCRTRCCVNPDHLRVVTPRQNALENSVSIPALHAQLECCPRCGGDYRIEPDGSRRCIACRRATRRAYWAANADRLNAARKPRTLTT